jgi:ABC-type histidine transport system ATPase subunit
VLAERRRQRADTLSGGEQQMVAIARALMGNPVTSWTATACFAVEGESLRSGPWQERRWQR